MHALISAIVGSPPAQIIAALAVAAALAATYLLLGYGARAGQAPDSKDDYVKPLLSDWERAELPRLQSQCPPGYHACPQVCLGRLVRFKADGTHAWDQGRHPAAWKIVDFAIIDPEGMVALVVELNDGTHGQPARRARDALVHAALRDAGIPLVTGIPFHRVAIAGALRQHRSSVVRRRPTTSSFGSARA